MTADQVVPGPAAAPEQARRRWPDDLRTGSLVVLLAMAVGVVAGLVWLKVAPRPLVQVGADHGASFVDGGGKAFIGADGWFAVIAVVAGLVVAALACWQWRRNGIGVVIGVTVGGLLGGLVASTVGQALGHVDLVTATAGLAPGATLEAGLKLRATGVLLLWPLASLLVVMAVGASYGLDDDPVETVDDPAPGAEDVVPRAAPGDAVPPPPGP